MENKKQKSRKRIALIAGAALLAGILGYLVLPKTKDENNSFRPQIIYPSAEAIEQSNEECPANPQNIGHNLKEVYQAPEESAANSSQPSNKGLAQIVAGKQTQKNRKPFEENAGTYKPQTPGNNPNPQYTDKETGENPKIAEPLSKEKEKILTSSVRKTGVEQELRIGEDGNLYLEIICNDAASNKHSYVLLLNNDGPLYEYIRIYANKYEPIARETGLGFICEKGWLVLGTREVRDFSRFTERSSENGGLEEAERLIYDKSWRKIRTDPGLESKLTEEAKREAHYIMEACQNGTRLQ